jgi:hypothetical protein
MLLYKIKRKTDGKFSAGGTSPNFSPTGKSWTRGHLKQHLALLKLCYGWHGMAGVLYPDCEIIEYTVEETRNKFNPEDF